MLYQFTIHSLYLGWKRNFSWCKLQCGLQALILCKATCKWPWRRQIFQNLPFALVQAASTSFSHMPFGLTNGGVSFCQLMDMCIGDQQYVNLLFYLDDICIFASSADQMLNHIKLVFSRLKEFHLKIKPKRLRNPISSKQVSLSLDIFCPLRVYHPIPKK